MNFSKRLEKITARLKAISVRLSKNLNSVDPVDLESEMILYLWEESKREGFYENTDSYLIQGAYFYIKNYIRRLKSRENSLVLDRVNDDSENCFADVLLKESSPEDSDILFDIDLCASEKLETREKKVLEYIEKGYTMREIGGMIGVSHVMVHKITNRLKEKLYACI